MDAVFRNHIQDALKEFGVTANRLTHLASRHNDVFRVDAASDERFVLRIQNHLMTDAQARSQVEWLELFPPKSDVIVPAPRRTLDGRPFTYFESGESRRRALLLQWLPGRPARTRNQAVYTAASQMVAKMHNHAERFRQPHGFSCRRLDGDHLFGQRFFVNAADTREHLSKSQRRTAADAERFVRDAMASLGHRKRRFGVIHADLNLDNIIFHRGLPSPIDFDEFGKCWYVFDLAELIRTSITCDNWEERKQLAISAYTEVRTLDDAELQAFDAFIVASFVQYLNWAFIHARSKDDLKWVGFCTDVISRIGNANKR